MNILAIVVTHNRLNLLQECINAIKNQSHNVDDILVVDNSSTDGTKEWLANCETIKVITQDNLGGAGGQFGGMKYAIENNYEWIWTMDDDTIPDHHCLKELVNASIIKSEGLYFASKVLWIDGSIHPGNVPKFVNSENINSSQIIRSTFVSLFFNANILFDYGYPLKQFYIWFDDWEFTTRLYFNGVKGYYVPESTVIHKTIDTSFYSLAKKNVLKKSYYLYGVRNDFFLQRKLLGKKKYYKNIVRTLFYFIKNKFPAEYYIGLFNSIFFNPKVEYPTVRKKVKSK